MKKLIIIVIIIIVVCHVSFAQNANHQHNNTNYSSASSSNGDVYTTMSTPCSMCGQTGICRFCYGAGIISAGYYVMPHGLQKKATVGLIYGLLFLAL